MLSADTVVELVSGLYRSTVDTKKVMRPNLKLKCT